LFPTHVQPVILFETVLLSILMILPCSKDGFFTRFCRPACIILCLRGIDVGSRLDHPAVEGRLLSSSTQLLNENNMTIIIVTSPAFRLLDSPGIILQSTCKNKGFPVNNKATCPEALVLLIQIQNRGGVQCGYIAYSGLILHQTNPG